MELTNGVDINCYFCVCNGPLRIGKKLEELETPVGIEIIQTTARIPRRVLETWGDLLTLWLEEIYWHSDKRPLDNANVKNSRGVYK